MSTIKKKEEELADAHWEYIKDLLFTHKITLDVITLCGFHYKSAFIHGYKHALEDKSGN